MKADETIRILYMEDDSALARLLQKSLERKGYVVDIACNGEEGLRVLEQSSYDVLLLDYEMPVCDGLGVIRRLASRGGVPPTIMVTGNGSEKIAVEAMRLGAADYIMKDTALAYLELIPIVVDKALHERRMAAEREEMFIAVQESEERYRSLVELSPYGIVTQVDEVITFANPGAALLLGAPSPNALIGKGIYQFLHEDYLEIVKRRVGGITYAGEILSWMEVVFVRFDARHVDVEMGGSWYTRRGKLAIQLIFRDISMRKAEEERLTSLAYYDELTGLSKRMLFFDRLRMEMKRAHRDDCSCALLFIDLDHFKRVNDAMGHDVGDLLLKEAAKRLKNCVREVDTVARMGGDEFAVVLSAITGSAEAELMTARMIEAMNKPFELKGQKCLVGASIGISVYPEDALNSETLLKNADIAMYRVKEKGRNDYEFFKKK